MNDTVTTDLTKFGYRELKMARDLLTGLLEKNDTRFLSDGVQIAFNTHSGNVFLTDEEYNVAMLTDDGVLEDWFTTPYEGHEGFLADLKDEYKTMHTEDQEFMVQITDA